MANKEYSVKTVLRIAAKYGYTLTLIPFKGDKAYFKAVQGEQISPFAAEIYSYNVRLAYAKRLYANLMEIKQNEKIKEYAEQVLQENKS